MSAQKESEAELQNRLAEAARLVKIGASYMHYKQKAYKVLALGLLEATIEPCVIYQAEYGKHITFIRPLKDWLEEVEWRGQKVKRFTER